MNKKNNLPVIMGEVKSREEVLDEVKRDPDTYLKFRLLDEEFQ